jgi:DNA-directed RNA polymerase specialized sigma24 family protein
VAELSYADIAHALGKREDAVKKTAYRLSNQSEGDNSYEVAG